MTRSRSRLRYHPAAHAMYSYGRHRHLPYGHWPHVAYLLLFAALLVLAVLFTGGRFAL